MIVAEVVVRGGGGGGEMRREKITVPMRGDGPWRLIN